MSIKTKLHDLVKCERDCQIKLKIYISQLKNKRSQQDKKEENDQ